MPRRFRINGPLLLGILLLSLGMGLYVGYPVLRSLAVSGASTSGLLGESSNEYSDENSSGISGKTPIRRPATVAPPMQEMLRERAITCVTGLWFFVFGATIGSFLNVVAYRMPMGLSFVAKPSRCPFCETPIRFRHNVPIFGWLVLRGRCHACRLPISVRYPLVEIIVGLLFFCLFFRELASGGANLPDESLRSRPGIMWNVLTPNQRLIGLYFFHALLLGLLATIALIKFDRLRIPVRLVLFAITAACVFRYGADALTISAWWLPLSAPSDLPAPWSRLVGLGLDLLIGLLVGWSVHCVIETQRTHRPSPSHAGTIAILATISCFLGWHVLVAITMLATIAQFFTMLVGRSLHVSTERLWASSYLVATTMVICLWRYLPTLGLPSAESLPLTHWGGLVISLFATYITARLSMQPF